MLRARFPTSHHFTVSIFGCQYQAERPDAAKQDAIQQFNSLIKPAAIHVEELEQNDLPSKIWMSYWPSPQAFKTWWESPETSSFWGGLPDDAGFWRETISLPATRSMYESNKPQPSGFGHCGEHIPLTSKSGYWGAYRSRMTPDGPDDKFQSPASPGDMQGRPLSKQIRSGRVRMAKFPDNICFVVEGQDYSAMFEREKEFWNKHFDGLAKQWVTTVVTTGPDKGMLSARACHAFEGEKHLGVSSNGAVAVNGNGVSDASAGAAPNGHSLFPGLDYIRQAQVLFWLDLSYMEHIGRHDKVHVKLRREFMTEYGPGGQMEGGDLLLWVDLGILKADEIDAEYVGCYDGTGFLAYDEHPLFQSEKVSKSTLPSFFDKPIESTPIEW
ncbi:hypothetical protein PFICI_13316 [Pestalotiopsis fici W106-1]|uniref:Phenylacetaldoxime dehydratase n=1 Tax=Pestalotiopsis fici (strain W106-1 / CGMCC3.15140) TaxID=1229662 RepID=W3WNY0_PESFW|nr:uncharacterized protein PFICI_13316 [Pestalotiopsis fici W106-1]ETS74832.1 hypothetical protein PFICI_13316 [Pestalotiopsis fici W106-1]